MYMYRTGTVQVEYRLQVYTYYTGTGWYYFKKLVKLSMYFLILKY
jgi:hypothetical protein